MPSTRLSFLLLMIFVLTFRTDPSISLSNFTFGETGEPFKCNPSGNIFCGGDAITTPGYLALTPLNDSPKDPDNTYGTAVTNKPILLLNSVTNRWDSFETSFQFLIEPSEAGPGDGMTFVMLSNSDFPGANGGNFGLYNDSGSAVVATLAIEFDTYLNPTDISDNHVGLDLETIRSVVARNASEVGIRLASSERVYSWISYESSSGNLEVRISLNNSRPVEAFLNSTVNLSDIFGENPQVYVGFTASNGYCDCHNFYSVYEWKFAQFSRPAQLAPPGPSPSSSPPDGLERGTEGPSTSTSGRHHRSAFGFIAGVTAGIFLFLLFLGMFFFLWSRRRSNSGLALGKLNDTAELTGVSENLRYTYRQLSLATDQFSEKSKLGQGGFGSVYRGVLASTGVPVAVKKVSHDSRQGIKQFVAEVTIISQLRHRNVVRLLGWCSDRNKFLLVYELMPNGSLDKALFHPPPGLVLSWKLRFQIVVGAAEALHYLHEGWRQQIIHRDFKSSNIMLDENFNAMLGDFGLARMVGRHEDPATTVVAGTFGYIAPEAPATGKFTDKTDVYAFGAVALELACGRMAYNSHLPEEESLLVDWVWKKLEQDSLMNAVDPRLEGQYDAQQIQALLLLGLLCSHPNPSDRPSMRHVLEILAGTVAMPPVPLSKPTVAYLNSGRQYCMEALHLMPSTDNMSLMDTEQPLDRRPISGAASESDPLIIYSKSSTESTASATVSEPMIEL